jgi:hypothetical protein
MARRQPLDYYQTLDYDAPIAEDVVVRPPPGPSGSPLGPLSPTCPSRTLCSRACYLAFLQTSKLKPRFGAPFLASNESSGGIFRRKSTSRSPVAAAGINPAMVSPLHVQPEPNVRGTTPGTLTHRTSTSTKLRTVVAETKSGKAASVSGSGFVPRFHKVCCLVAFQFFSLTLRVQVAGLILRNRHHDEPGKVDNDEVTRSIRR